MSSTDLPDISKLSIAELRILMGKCDVRIRELSVAEEKAAFDQMNSALTKLKELGKSVDDLPEEQQKAFRELQSKTKPQKRATAGRPANSQVKAVPGDPGDPRNANFYDSKTGDWHSGFGSSKAWPDWLKEQKKDAKTNRLTSEQRNKLIADGKLKRKDQKSK